MLRVTDAVIMDPPGPYTGHTSVLPHDSYYEVRYTRVVSQAIRDGKNVKVIRDSRGFNSFLLSLH